MTLRPRLTTGLPFHTNVVNIILIIRKMASDL